MFRANNDMILHIILIGSLTTYLICRCSPTKSRLKSFNLMKLSLYWPLRGLLVEQVIRRSRSVIAVTCVGEEDTLSNLISLVASAKNAFQRSRSLCSAAFESFKKNVLIVSNLFNQTKKFSMKNICNIIILSQNWSMYLAS